MNPTPQHSALAKLVELHCGGDPAVVEHWLNDLAPVLFSPEEIEAMRQARVVDAPVEWDGETCKWCGTNSYVGFSVPDDLWAEVMGADEARTICVNCWGDRAGDHPWANQATLYPVDRSEPESATGMPTLLCVRCMAEGWPADGEVMPVGWTRVVREVQGPNLGFTITPNTFCDECSTAFFKVWQGFAADATGPGEAPRHGGEMRTVEMVRCPETCHGFGRCSVCGDTGMVPLASLPSWQQPGAVEEARRVEAEMALLAERRKRECCQCGGPAGANGYCGPSGCYEVAG